MIKDKIINIVINNRNIKRLKEHFKTINIGDKIDIPIDLLSKGSHVKVICICDKCGSEKEIMYQKYIKNIDNGGYYSCSSKCSQEKVKNTSINRYGDEYYTKTLNYKEKSKTTNLSKYGSEYYLTSDVGKKNISNIMLDKYGCINPFSSPIIIDKIRETTLEKYGVDNISKLDYVKKEISTKVKSSWESRFKIYYEKYNLNVINFSENNYNIECNVCKNIFEINRLLLSNRLLLKTTICTFCNPKNDSIRSGYERELFEFIKEIYNGEIIQNKKNVIKYELDIYLPNIGIAFEFNGLYWHSNKFKEKDYHYKKHQLCKEMDFELVQIWEDDWLYRKNIIKSIISNKIGQSQNRIFARKCIIKLIDSKESNSFLSGNHLQGPCKSNINIGLYYNNELVSLMTFGKLRNSLGSKSSEDKYELHRFCNKLNYSVVGGSSKILKYFMKNYQYSQIISYYDKSFGFKSFYEKIGFKFIGETPINYWYVVRSQRIHRYNFRKDRLVKMGYNKNLTESQITTEIGIPKIHGVGNYKYLIEA